MAAAAAFGGSPKRIVPQAAPAPAVVAQTSPRRPEPSGPNLVGTSMAEPANGEASSTGNEAEDTAGHTGDSEKSAAG